MIQDLIARHPGNSAAIGAPDRPSLTYDRLRTLIDETGAALRGLGVARDDRVAIVLPNGPEMATAFLGVAGAAVAAPLNPAYREEEFDFYISDLDARLLIVEQGSASPALAAAKKRGVAIATIDWSDEAPAGDFSIAGAGGGAVPDDGTDDDSCLVLHTSGTTSRPKIVPLSHANLAASARNIGASLELTDTDRCLNVMPLFHIHGLIAAVLSGLAAGGEVVCTPGFNALRFRRWLDDIKPTWYTAVPTMHQAILSRVKPGEPLATTLRFIRSSSSSLPPQVMAALEETFGCPVIEAYGMTEATHQMASNPLPPAPRKPGTVGIAAGPEVAIADAEGHILEQGAPGEIVISGPNVTAGYESNPQANAENFFDREDGNGRWFRTGDQGMIDEEGYLSITGRLKEIINRGGEKISPREVDDILMDHEAVAQVVTFAMPHDKLGEDVAAAIVLREGAAADERAIRDFAAARLAPFKVPRRILFLDEIPKGSTGKLQRIGLAEKLGLA